MLLLSLKIERLNTFFRYSIFNFKQKGAGRNENKNLRKKF